MTLKHIPFHHSPVMRELERIAVKKGHFDPTPEEVVDTAVSSLEQTPLEPTEDLFNDVMRLAAALRANGFTKQAEDVEQRAVSFKVAERHLYRVHDEDGPDFLEFAHPEGDFEVAPAAQDNGKVETILSQHKRIMDVVQSAPTGKLAEIANEVVKFAQAGSQTIKFSALSNKVDEAASIFNVNADGGTDVVGFTEQRILGLHPGYLKAYHKYSGVVPATVEQYKKYIDSVYAGQPATSATIAGIINSTQYDSLYNWVVRNWPDLAQYVTGSRPSVAKSLTPAKDATHPIWQDNANSVWEMGLGVNMSIVNWTKNPGAVRALADQIQDSIVKLRNSVVGGKVDGANAKLGAAMQSAMGPWLALKETFEDVKYDPALKESVDNIISKINGHLESVSSYLPSGDGGGKVNSVFPPFYPAGVKEFFGKVNSIRSVLVKLLAKVGGAVGGGLGTIVESTGEINAKYRSTIGIWEKYLRSLPDNSNEALLNAVNQNLEASKKFYRATDPESSNGQPYSVVFGRIGVKALDSLDKLMSHANEWLNFSRQQTGIKEAAIGKSLEKHAQPVGGVALPGAKPAAPATQPTKPAQPSAGKPVAQPAGPGAGMARSTVPGRPTEKERQNVSLMQRLMSELALGLDKQADQVSELLVKKDSTMTAANIKNFARIIADTGKGVQTPFDGVWGQRTKKGLEAVNLFTYRAGVGTVDSGDGSVPYRDMTPEEATARASKNAQLISQLMNKLGLGQFRKTEVPGAPAATVQGPLDVVPQSLTNASILDRKGTVPIYEANLLSLQDFFAYLTGQGFAVNMPAPKAASQEHELEKLAFEIQGQPADWVWRTAPAWDPVLRPQVRPAGGVVTPTVNPDGSSQSSGQSSVQQPQGADMYTMTVAQLDGAFRWFLQRAYQLARLAATPQEGKPVDPQAYERAMHYRQALDALYREWWAIRQSKQLKPNDSVNLFSLNEWAGPSSPGAGLPRPGGESGEGIDVGGPGGAGMGAGGRRSPGLEATEEPPFTDARGNPRRFIDLEFLAKRYRGGDIKRYFSRTLLDKQSLEGTPQSFAAMFASDAVRRGMAQNTVNYRNWVALSCDYILYQLRVVFENWRKEVARVARPTRDARVESLIADNNDELQDWAARLLALAQEANQGR